MSQESLTPINPASDLTSSIDYVYRTDIDYDRLAALDQQGVIDYAYENFRQGDMRLPYKDMAKVMLSTCKTVGLQPDNEQLLFILANKHRILCESCAGSGKTTMSQMSVLKYKMIQGIPTHDILCLAYNRNAVADMATRHFDLVNKINAVLKHTYNKQIAAGKATREWKDVKVDEALHVSTMHAWAREWIVTMHDQLGLPDKASQFSLDEEMASKVMTRILRQAQTAKQVDFFLTKDAVSEALGLYAYAKETLTLNNPQAWATTMPGNIAGLNAQEMQRVFLVYEQWKRDNNKLDFNDEIDALYQLMCAPENCLRMRRNYSVILVDEYQDITPSMLRNITLFAEGSPEFGIPRYDELHLICVGDSDQSIYGFRGTDPHNCIRFKRDYYSILHDDTRILSMSVNRRCATRILENARRVIEHNKSRIQKPIRGLREGGEFKLHEYIGPEDELASIINILRNMTEPERGSTCICYRNNLSSKGISMKMFEAGIPFKSLRQNDDMFADPISKFYKNLTTLFQFPDNKNLMSMILYRLLPQSKVLTKTELENEITKAPENTKFWELGLEKKYAAKVTDLPAVMNEIIASYKAYRAGSTLADFMPRMFARFRKKDHIYFRRLTEPEKLFFQQMQNWFSQNITARELALKQQQIQEKFAEANRRNLGVKLSSFHGLKGLEFDNIIIIDMHDDLFPGMELNRNKDVTAKQQTLILQEAERLFYVAITRARNRCDIFYNRQVRSRLIRLLEDGEESLTNAIDVMQVVDANFMAQISSDRIEKEEALRNAALPQTPVQEVEAIGSAGVVVDWDNLEADTDTATAEFTELDPTQLTALPSTRRAVKRRSAADIVKDMYKGGGIQ